MNPNRNPDPTFFATRRAARGRGPIADPRTNFCKVCLTTEERKRVEAEAITRGVSISAIVRDGLALYFAPRADSEAP